MSTFKPLLILLLAFAAGGLQACKSTPAQPDVNRSPAATVFVGNVRTMDSKDTVAEAVAVDARGLILAVGTEQEVMTAVAGGDPAPVVVRLEPGQTLLPGFIDAHMHVMGLMQQSSGLIELVGPCRPAPYAAGEGTCSNYIGESLDNLTRAIAGDTSGTFVIGMNLDPSRQPYDKSTSSAQFKANPAQYIEEKVSKTRPVLLLDQSGHFGYVNHAAFDALQALYQKQGKAWPPTFTEGGEWAISDPTAKGNAKYSGLLIEIEAYNAFFPAVERSAFKDLMEDPEKYISGEAKGVKELLANLREAGLTTLTSMAQTDSALRGTMLMAELPASGTRMLSVVTPELANTSLHQKPVLPACDPRSAPDCRLPKNLGVNGIKVIMDGSTQGCTAALAKPTLYVKTGECSPPQGRPTDLTPDVMHDQLAGLWQAGTWRFETHANGNLAISTVLGVYARLQSESRNPHTATLIHSTVGDEAVWKSAGDLIQGRFTLADGKVAPQVDLRFTHLLGHVAYWGAVFERQLGPAAAANIDPLAYDKRYGIPFSLHSDAPVSIPNPLWFVRQAVTRETWSYPELNDKDKQVLGPEHRISVRDALRAVTIAAAQEKELAQWIGSIEVGKVADFVLLSADPVAFDPATGGDPTRISEIKVVNTYLGGQPTGRQ